MVQIGHINVVEIFLILVLYGRINLDVLIINSYAANDSKYNPVERTLSYLSKQLTSVVLNRKISNKTSEQDNLDNAVTILCSYWDKKFYDSYQISCIPVISHSILLYSGHSDRINLLKAEKYRENSQNKGIHDKFRFFMKHCRRSKYLILFIKCDDPNYDVDGKEDEEGRVDDKLRSREEVTVLEEKSFEFGKERKSVDAVFSGGESKDIRLSTNELLIPVDDVQFLVGDIIPINEFDKAS
ncbi:unnamed protein product [Didymodactylos carnosus]|uniref:Uncharacterized protein n=1 Tax=Didymodactylos carnosus TaxID=1234261 RepID=A0A8S2D8H6_9BILA|nr:unnamed protein product [Didymodactylos carnosus]CAF3685648.1 unnamed protein product [Didymodactylos carnosus]